MLALNWVPRGKSSLLHLRQFKREHFLSFFEDVRRLKNFRSARFSQSSQSLQQLPEQQQLLPSPFPQRESLRMGGGEGFGGQGRETLGLLFFEPSTRTRMSFETAAHRIGLAPLVLDGGGRGSSLEKGESLEDSILNIAAMEPRLLVIRCGDGLDLGMILERLHPLPMINAGWGVQGHPTQALLDMYTIWETLGRLEDLRLLIVGDIKHSRVASSHLEWVSHFGVRVGICGPRFFIPSSIPPGVEVFEDFEEGLRWADLVMTIRVQFERHHQGEDSISGEEAQKIYKRDFTLSLEKMKLLREGGLHLDPGPIHHGVGVESEVLTHPRSLVLQQVTNGVYVREVLIRGLLAGS